MAWFFIVVAASLILGLGYRYWKYRRIKQAGYEVQWRSPVMRWWRKARGERVE